MDFHAVIVIAGVIAALVAMARSWLAPELALSATLALFIFTGTLSPGEALRGFSSSGLHTVALLFVVSEGIRRSGAMELFAQPLLGKPRSETQAQLRLMLPVATLSTALNNTPVVALFLPLVRKWGRAHGIAPSRLMIPLSFAAILGGTCTLIGTSTNLVVRALLPEGLDERFGMFTIGAVGLPAAVAGLLVILVLGRRFLPIRGSEEEMFSDPRTFTSEVIVDEGGWLVGRRLDEIRNSDAGLLTPVEIDRQGTILPAPSLEEKLQGGDRLVLAGAGAATVALHGLTGLTPAHDRIFDNARDGRRRIFELVISPRCPLVGRKVGDGSFRAQYNAAVLAVARHGEAVNPHGVGGWRLEVGDSVLVEADRGFAFEHRTNPDFIVITGHKQDVPAARWHPLAGVFVLLGLLGVAGSGLMQPFLAAAMAATAVLLLRLLPWSKVLSSLDGPVLLSIATALGVGAAIEKTGVAATAAGWLVSGGAGSPLATLGLLYFTTVVVTIVVTNNATAAIMIPLALAAAAQLQVDPMPFVVAITMGASSGFITPIGYQTNLMVYGPGSYRFYDFFRIGGAVTLAVAAVTLVLAPMIWPF